MTQEEIINQQIQDAKVGNKPDVVSPFNTNLISDGYHTFGELYEHRIALFIALCKQYQGRADIDSTSQHTGSVSWKSRKHSDGELAFGGSWFVLGINKEKGEQITYHLPLMYWGDCDFAETLETAPEFDGHTSADVLERLKQL